MALDAGSVAVTLRGDFNQGAFDRFSVATLRARTAMENAEKVITASSKRSSAALDALGTAAKSGAAIGIVAVGAALVSSVKDAIAFEKAMRNVNTIARVSDRELKTMSKSVLDLAGKTAQAPKTLAEGLYDIVSSGFKGKDALTILEKSAYAASAGMTDTATATKAVVAVLNAYQLPATQAGKVSDQLFGIVDRGVITFEELARQLGDVLPFGKQLGVGLDQLGGSIATLTKGGMPSAIAMTALKGALVAFIRPSDQMAQSIKKAGFANGEAIIKARGFQGALEAVSKTSGGTASAMAGLFPDVQGLAGALALTGSKAKDAEADLAAMGNVTGKTGKAFAEQSKSTAFQFAQLKTNLTVLKTEVGTALLPALNDAAKGVSRFVAEINAGQGSGHDFVVNLTHSFDGLLGVITTLNDATIITLKTLNLLTKIGQLGMGPGLGLDGFIATMERGNNAIDDFREKVRHAADEKTGGVKILHLKAEPGEALRALKAIEGEKVAPKVVKVLASGDTTVKAKIKALVGLGIPSKTAKILAENADALTDIKTVKAALAALRDKTVTLTTREIREFKTVRVDSGDILAGTKKKAAGRGPGPSETALVGEGNAGELVGSPSKGWTWVDKPTLMGLAPGDSVIPTDPQYGGRALGLMFAAMGVPGYAAGRAAWGRPIGGGTARAPARKTLAVPARIQFAAVPEDELLNSRNDARESYQKRKETVRGLGVDIRAQRRKVAEAKAGKPKNAARAKLRDLEADHARYLYGKGGLSSLSDMRKRYETLKAQFAVLHKANLEIGNLDAQQEAARGRMDTASKRGDAAGWGTAKARRAGLLERLRAKYALALRYAKPGSTFAAELEGKLAGVEGDIADVDAAELEETPEQKAIQEAVDRLSDTGMTDAERAQLAQLEADQSLAGLTTTLDDDKVAAQHLEEFFTGILGAVQSDPARGGAASVRDIADRLKSARDNLKSLTDGSAQNDNANLQAQLDQRTEELRVARRESEINSLGLATYRGATDIGTGPQVVQNNYMLHPSDPAVLSTLADASVAGMALQASRSTPRTHSGL